MRSILKKIYRFLAYAVTTLMFFSFFLNIFSFFLKESPFYAQNKVIDSILLLCSILFVKKYYKPFL